MAAAVADGSVWQDPLPACPWGQVRLAAPQQSRPLQCRDIGRSQPRSGAVRSPALAADMGTPHPSVSRCCCSGNSAVPGGRGRHPPRALRRLAPAMGRSCGFTPAPGRASPAPPPPALLPPGISIQDGFPDASAAPRAGSTPWPPALAGSARKLCLFANRDAVEPNEGDY
ncbi:uncharacterized protein LOC141732302 isoform X3 [Larus michahellis]|uniref:uncharacterized protein LOC141732302 isoform X3 n=1 Tax=Larus michahellis TaxID=119627 RepID=UPI003D9B9BBC